jgi:hypothetical protein
VKSQPLSGWDFFCPFPQCWRGFGRFPLEHGPAEVIGFGELSAVFLSLFSAALLSIQGPKSCIGAGLRAIGSCVTSSIMVKFLMLRVSQHALALQPFLSCRVPDDWLLKNKRPLLHGREVLQAVLATWQSRAKELPC